MRRFFRERKEPTKDQLREELRQAVVNTGGVLLEKPVSCPAVSPAAVDARPPVVDATPAPLRDVVKSIVALSMVLLIGGAAFAKDTDGRYAGTPLHEWFEGLRSQKGPCCSDADGTALSDVDWESHDGGHYRVRIMEEWFDVPDEAVLTVPNLAHKTMVWPVYQDGRVHYIRCFIPGEMS